MADEPNVHGDCKHKQHGNIAAVQKGLGLARTLAAEMGIELSDEPIDYEALRDEMYDDMLDRIKEETGMTLD